MVSLKEQLKFLWMLVVMKLEQLMLVVIKRLEIFVKMLISVRF